MKKNAVLACALLWGAVAAAQPILSVDFNRRNSTEAADTFPGFQSFIISSNGGVAAIQTTPTTRTFGPFTVTLANSGGPGYDDRLRGTPVNSGAFTDSLLLRDFVFSREQTGTSGLDVTVEGLTPDAFYRVTIWSFDTGSGGNRVSDWTANGNVAISGYAFNGNVLPTTNTQYRFSFVAVANGSGQVVVSGRRNPASVDTAGAAQFGVFLNALQIEPTDPRPSITAQPQGRTNQVGDRVTLTAATDGAPPLSLQWFKNGAEVPGATANSLSLSNLVVGDSGDYTLRVTNLYGTNLSSVAALFVLPEPTPDLRQGIVSYWSLDEQLEDNLARPTFSDPYGHNDLKVVANSIYIDQLPGVSGNAALFNGVEQYCYREGGFPAYGPSAFSVALWVNAAGGQIDRRIFAETSTNNNTPVFSLGTHSTGANGTLRVFIRDDSGTVLVDRNSTRTVFDGTLHHVVWSEANGEARLYIDGTLDETSFSYARGPLSLGTTAIGALLRSDGATNFFSGQLDEIAVWSRVISFTEAGQLRTGVVPPPLSNSPPSITLQPASRSVFTRANVTFSFAASGTGPLFVQWRKEGADLVDETNATLVLNNVTLADAGNFDVVVANAVGSATSQVATVTVTLRPVTTDLKLDFNNLGADDVPANTEPGFSSFPLIVAVGPGPVTRMFGGAEITLSAAGGINMQSRKRPLPTNMLAFTEERLLQDFVFAPDTAAGQGLDVAIRFLEPNQTYALTIWSFDNVNNGRLSDWSANGTTLRIGYTFTGSNLPTDNSSSRFTVPVVADAQGTILIQGRRNDLATAANNVFLNALQITAFGELRVRKIEVVAPSSLRLTFDAINPAATHRVEEKINVDDPTWTEVVGAVFGAPNGNTIEVTIPVPATATRFYHIAETP
jgi:hypothetical protein